MPLLKCFESVHFVLKKLILLYIKDAFIFLFQINVVLLNFVHQITLIKLFSTKIII